MNSDDEAAMPRPRWHRRGRPSVLGRTKGIKNKVWRPRPKPREAWDPKYTREMSPGRAGRKRIDLRATTDPLDAWDADAAGVRDLLMDLGILRQWRGATCLRCGCGRYGQRIARDMVRCGKCRSYLSVWHASAFSNGGLAEKKCHQLSLAYASRLSPTQGSLMARVSRATVTRVFNHFRAAEASKGLDMRDSLVFEGTPDHPAEVEVDETCVRKVHVKDPYIGTLLGTWHYSFFAMKLRGSRRGVVYAMEPRFVEASENGKPSAPPPPKADEVGPWILKHVGNWVILHSDGAGAYPKVLALALARQAPDGSQATPQIWLDQVDHSGSQFTRFHRHNVAGMSYPHSRIRVTAGTQLVDGFWNVLKHHAIPEEARTDVALFEQYALALLWSSFSMGDPLCDLGVAVQHYMAQTQYQRPQDLVLSGKLAAALAVEPAEEEGVIEGRGM